MTDAAGRKNNVDTPVVVDAVYDDDAAPDAAMLSKHLPLKRPLIQDDNKVILAVAADYEMRNELPSNLKPADMNTPPYSHAGRLNVHWSSANKDVHGSAQFIAPNLILTAAHCVRWAGQWNRNLYFLQRYNQGASDAPVFKIEKVGVMKGWFDLATSDDPDVTAWPYDVAVLKISGTQKAGYAPAAPLADDMKQLTSFGYPSNFEDGQVMFCDDGKRTEGALDGTIGLTPSEMGFGASGGGWFVKDQHGIKIIGLNSYKMSAPKIDYSPIFGTAAMNLIKHMASLS